MSASRWISPLIALGGGLLVTSCSSDTVAPGSVAAIAVLPAEDSVRVGGTITLQATAQGADGDELDGEQVFWNSENPDVATVSDQGVVTGVAEGTTRIAASAEGRSGFARVTVLPKSVASVVVTPPSASIRIGKTFRFEAVTRDDTGKPLTGRTVTWSSSNSSVATVDENGVVTGVGAGAAVITARSEGREGTAAVEVKAPQPASVVVSPTEVEITVGETSQLSATVRDEDGKELPGAVVAWASNQEDVATVSSSGLVQGLAPGQATITAISGGKSASAKVTVKRVPVDRVTVSPNSARLSIGRTVQLTAQALDRSGSVLTERQISWATSDDRVATVDQSGLVTAVRAGTATITATSEGKSGAATVQVTLLPIARIEVTPDMATLTVGESTQLTATPRDEDGNTLSGRTITWTTSDRGVADVNGTGRVHALAVGAATITATSEGQSGAAAVTVAPPAGDEEEGLVISPADTTIAIGARVQLVAEVDGKERGKPKKRDTSWSSSDPLVASVSESGVVRGVAPGAATITATRDDRRGTSTVRVVRP